MNSCSQADAVFRLDTEELPANTVSEVRLAIDVASLRYPGIGRVTIDAGVLRVMLDTLEDYAAAEDGLDADYEKLADNKAERIRKVLAEHKGKQSPTPNCATCGAPTDGECHYENPIPSLCEAVDNLLDDL